MAGFARSSTCSLPEARISSFWRARPDEALLQYFAQELDLDLPEVVVLPHSRYLDLAEIWLLTFKLTISALPGSGTEESDDSATLRISRTSGKMDRRLRYG